MLKNKKILMICKETFSYPLYYLAKGWRDENKVASYFFNPAECMFNSSTLNSTTYYKHKELEKLEVFDVKDIVELFTENLNNPKLDMDYIKMIESKYTNFKNINLQLLSTQKMSTYYHDRDFYTNSTHEQQLFWLELNYKKALEIFDDFQPDIIIDTDNSELARTVLSEIAYAKKIPYITICYPRYELYKIPTSNFSVGIEKTFKNCFKEKFNLLDESLSEEFKYVNEFRRKDSIMSAEFKNDSTSQYDRDSIFFSLKKIIGKFLYFWNQDITAKNLFIKRKNKILFGPSYLFLWFFIKVEIKKWYLLGGNSFFSNPNEGEKYVYMPLHLIPESSTLTAAPFYINELMVIEQVSKSLPAGWMLYVKEHQSMLGERSLKFYKKVNYLHNVKMISVNYYKDPKPLISFSQGVITITGTSAYEAALLGKRSIVFGDVPFNLIEGISRVRSFEDLPSLISSFGVIDNIKSCAAYIASVKSEGSEINLKYLMREGEEILQGNTKISKKFENQIDRLKEFFEKGYNRYTESNTK
jgi:hypothetical protein